MDFKDKIVYQIYPKSFMDSKGDGLGDLRGIISKLDYLAYLGVDYIWLTPFFQSPQNDNGYDISDYLKIDQSYGSMEDFDRLVEEAGKRDIKLMLDLVLNHCSTEHKWFKKALRGQEDYKDYFILRRGKEGGPPSNWSSKFGGSAWEYIEEFDQYYLHLFHKSQADLNWENKELRNEIYKIVNFWMDRGVEGFRLDVINLISKPDLILDDFQGDGRRFYTDGPRVHQYIKELNQNTFGKNKNILTVGEMSSTDIENCIRYSNPEEEELSMVFNFHHLKVDYKDGDKWSLMDFDFLELKRILFDWQLGLEAGNAWQALFLSNHDQPRQLSRFGDPGDYHKESAKMLATSLHMLRGTPYIYQGEEIGMTNPNFESIDQYRDIESLQYYKILAERSMKEEDILEILRAKSRDNSRTPLQWNSHKNAGFSQGKPWIDLADNYKKINVAAALEDEDSIFYHYKKLIELRKKMKIISHGSIRPLLVDHSSILAYIREYKGEKLLVVSNFYKGRVEFKPDIDLDYKDSKLIISNYKDSSSRPEKLVLRPYESLVFLLK